MTDREGPSLTLKASCFGCKFEVSESYRVQSDSGSDVFCAHPSHEKRRRVGDTIWTTPDWCPLADIPAIRKRLASPAEPVDETERLRAWPAALTQGLREILGIPNFQCGPMAHAYQKIGEFSGADGLALEKRAEDEQAFILHKLLCFWFEHGDGWREPAIDEIDRAAKAARAALQHKGEVSRG